MRQLALMFGACVLLALIVPDAVAEKKFEHRLITAKQLKTSAKLCENKWPKKAKPSRAMTDRCMQFWLFTHNYKRPSSLEKAESTFSLDPYPVSSPRHTADYYQAMSAHVKRAFPNDESWLVVRGLEFFDASASSYTSYFDMNVDLIDGLRTIILGKSYKPADLKAAANPTTSWFLRNAAFARHGRKFKHPDLNHYFYGKWKRPDQLKGLLPVKINSKFKDEMLTKVDRANVRAIDKAAAAK